MRHYGIHTLTVETAGQSGPGALVALTGIQDAIAFRESVLAQRDKVADKETKNISSDPAQSASNNDQLEVLQEIRDTLQRIEQKMEK